MADKRVAATVQGVAFIAPPHDAAPPPVAVGDPSVGCLMGITTTAALAALLGSALLAVGLTLAGLPLFPRMVAWCVGTPFAAALGGIVAVYLQLRFGHRADTAGR